MVSGFFTGCKRAWANNAGFCPVNISSNYRIVVLVVLIEIVIFIFNYYDDDL